MKRILSILVVLAGTFLASFARKENQLHVLELDNLHFTTKRPAVMSVTFCTSAAFVASDRKSIVGPYYCIDSHKFGSTRQAVFYRKNNRYGICWGSTFKQSYYKGKSHSGDFFFTQIPLVMNGKVVTSKTSKHNCRAIALKGQKLFYIETASTMTMKEFARQICELGYSDAIYLDSGSYGFGWYRKGMCVSMLKSCKFSKTLATFNQNNWIYCK